jgi:beta-mannosidase
MFQWDWSPRLLTCGIWQGVTLCTHQSLTIRDVFLVSDLRDGYAQVRIQVEVENLTDDPQQADFEACLADDHTYATRLEASLVPGWNRVDTAIPVEDPHLWWPNGSGDPYLYDFSLTVSDGEEQRDQWHCRYGIRQVELVQEPCSDGSQSFYFVVNGQRVFSKGANWAPADCFPTRPGYDGYRALVKAAADAHFNMFRVNGVGLYEKDSFYDCCDELGVMVWQDFTYSCGHYPDDDGEFMREAEREAELVVRRLRNHPSLVLWCGNNENDELHYSAQQAGDVDHFYGRDIYHRVLPRVCGCLDPTRPYWPSSSYGGEDPNSPRLGDRHSGVSFAPGADGYRGYANDDAKFVSEFYAMSAGLRQSLERFIPADEMSPASPAWEFHNNLFERGMMATILRRYFGLEASDIALDDHLLYTQIAQGEVLKFALEHYRRRKYDCGGALFWSYNDCWGTTTGWTIIDYYLNLKPSYYYVRRAMQPVLVSFREEAGGLAIWLTSDTRQEIEGHLDYGLMTLGGEEITHESKPVMVPADGSLKIAECQGPADLAFPSSECFWWARLRVAGHMVGENRHFLAPLEELVIPESRIRHRLETVDGRGLLRVQADSYAWVVRIAAPTGVALEDNYFDVFPGDEKLVAVEGPAEALDHITVSATRKPAASL